MTLCSVIKTTDDLVFSWINRDKCEPVETYVSRWLDLGVTWIGGCCRTYAIDVSRICREVEKWRRNEQEKQHPSS